MFKCLTLFDWYILRIINGDFYSSWFWWFERFFLLDTLGGIFGLALVIFLFFSPALLLASVIRWALQKYKVIACCCNLLLFHLYTYVVYIRPKKTYNERVFDIPKDTLEYDVYLSVFFHTFILLVISEFLIFKRDKKHAD